jgi:hypothetical protein
VLGSLGLLWSADVDLSNSDCAALRAMTGPIRESAVMLSAVLFQLLKLWVAIHDFDDSVSILPFSFSFFYNSLSIFLLLLCGALYIHSPKKIQIAPLVTELII